MRLQVGRERKGEAPGERGLATQPQLSQPERCEPAGAHEAEEHEQVPGRHGPECPLQRPVDGPEWPAGEIPARLDLRLKAVRVTPRRPPVFELVPDEPELVADLEVVARRRFAVPGAALSHEGLSRSWPGPGRKETCPEVERAGERYKARAAASSSSKSGTSPVS